MIKHSKPYSKVLDEVIATTSLILDIKVLASGVLLLIVHRQDEIVDDVRPEEGVAAEVHHPVVSPPQVVMLGGPELLGLVVQQAQVLPMDQSEVVDGDDSTLL